MSALVVVNPHATGVDRARRDCLLDALRGITRTETAETTGRGHAVALAREAMRGREVDVVVALGGDGTVNEIANGLLADGVHGRVPVLGVVPGGATNVFARSLGLPRDFRTATDVLRCHLRTARYRTIGVGRVDERYFLFAAGVGPDAAIVADVEEQRARGRRSSLARTAGTAARHLLVRSPPELRLRRSGSPPCEGVRWLVVANSDPWTYVGRRPLRATPRASFDTRLDLCARRTVNPLALIRSVARMAGRTPHEPCSGELFAHDVDRFTVRSDRPVPVHVDGDPLGHRVHLEFASVSRALRVLAPPPLDQEEPA
ncbi:MULTISPECIES: diacylglycerol/lipid kinase family protein [unclassified Streptomyces]|uniref:diacylglycerol/lipid kinase family protein n=1 Tax=unclassified Streptomyces TaxID=2593676 RepID=UPI0034296BF1